MRLTPVLAARSQLLTAIELFFADKDPVSVQALAGNARELLEKLCRSAYYCCYRIGHVLASVLACFGA
jgi:hypothetical protein